MKIGWQYLTTQEAQDLGLEQPCRWSWRVWRIEIFGVGFVFTQEARVRGGWGDL